MIRRSSVLALCLLVSVDWTDLARVSRQISFSDSKPPVSSGSISFSNGVKEGKKNILLKNILKNEAPSATLQTRFNFGSSRTKTGESCVTPLREPGQCSYITEPSCRPVLAAVLRHGVTQSILRYLLAAIKEPCGFQSHDLTLCCASQETLQPPPSPQPLLQQQRRQLLHLPPLCSHVECQGWWL